VAIVCGLLVATRFDLLLLGLPAVVAACRGVRLSSAAGALALGFALPAAWCAFATVYYGTPFPITAYTKAFCHGIPALDLAAQGMRYVWRNLVDDPLTVLAIPAGIGLGFARHGTRALALGTLLYTAYVVRVGGDYMLGRFLVPSFMAGTLLCMSTLKGRSARVHAAAIVAALLLAFVPGTPEAARPMPDVSPGYPIVDGIVDEQLLGRWDHGLLAPSAHELQPGFITAALRARGVTRQVFTVGGSMGWLGLASGPQAHVIDPWLCDPLLMRLPLADPARWRPGHFFRRIPAGYLESLANGDNRIRHAGLARVHDAVRSMTRDPIWSRARWAHMADLWLGRLDAGLADYVSEEYRSPPRIDVPFAEMATPPPPGSSWFESEHARTAQAGGLAVRFDGPTTASRVVAHVTGALWRLGFERNGDITGTVEVRITQPPDLLQPQNFAVPAGASPFDTILVDAIVDLESPTAACIAAIELVP
jgi:arabinofuranosyltransferase